VQYGMYYIIYISYILYIHMSIHFFLSAHDICFISKAAFSVFDMSNAGIDIAD